MELRCSSPVQSIWVIAFTSYIYIHVYIYIYGYYGLVFQQETVQSFYAVASALFSGGVSPCMGDPPVCVECRGKWGPPQGSWCKVCRAYVRIGILIKDKNLPLCWEALVQRLRQGDPGRHRSIHGSGLGGAPSQVRESKEESSVTLRRRELRFQPEEG